MFLVLWAAPFERMNQGRIFRLVAAATFLLLAGIFGFLHGFQVEPPPTGLLVASGVLIMVAAVLEVRLLVTLVGSWRAAGRRGQ